MNRPVLRICFTVAFPVAVLALALRLGGPSIGEAHDATSTSPVDCSKADAMMVQPATSTPAIQPTGDIDKDFARSMVAHNDAMTAMLKTEIACGKNPKVKGAAHKMLGQKSLNDSYLRQLTGGGG